MPCMSEEVDHCTVQDHHLKWYQRSDFAIPGGHGQSLFKMISRYGAFVIFCFKDLYILQVSLISPSQHYLFPPPTRGTSLLQWKPFPFCKLLIHYLHEKPHNVRDTSADSTFPPPTSKWYKGTIVITEYHWVIVNTANKNFKGACSL